MFARRRLNRIRQECRVQLEDLGYSDDHINSVIGQITDTKVHEVASEIPDAVGKLGDGTILQAIIDFLKSPQGQQLIAALVKMLISLLAGL